MNKRKIVIITIIVVALILIAVSSWLIYKKFLNKEIKRRKKDETDTTDTTTPPDFGTTNITGPTKPIELTDVKAFQIYANAKGYTPRLAEDNKWGPATAAAWNIYGSQYKNYSLAKSPIVASGSAPAIIYAKFAGTPIWNNVEDWIPYRLANQNEFIGTTDGTIVKNSNGNKFYKLNFTVGGDKTTKYVKEGNATMSSNYSSSIQTIPTFLTGPKI
jgi:hypothetical protein